MFELVSPYLYENGREDLSSIAGELGQISQFVSESLFQRNDWSPKALSGAALIVGAVATSLENLGDIAEEHQKFRDTLSFWTPQEWADFIRGMKAAGSAQDIDDGSASDAAE